LRVPFAYKSSDFPLPINLVDRIIGVAPLCQETDFDASEHQRKIQLTFHVNFKGEETVILLCNYCLLSIYRATPIILSTRFIGRGKSELL
jgi:hypothetical protein